METIYELGIKKGNDVIIDTKINQHQYDEIIKILNKIELYEINGYYRLIYRDEIIDFHNIKSYKDDITDTKSWNLYDRSNNSIGKIISGKSGYVIVTKEKVIETYNSSDETKRMLNYF